MKASFGLSCFPIHRNDVGVIDLPEDIKIIFAQLFTARIIPIPPLQVLFFSNYITHAIAAVMNIGRLRDPVNSLTKRAEQWLLELDERTPRAETDFFFYGEGSNTYVCNVQEQVDQERRKVAKACGLHLNSLLQECNDEYGTNYATLREYCLAPSPHNVHYACPDNMEHRYFLRNYAHWRISRQLQLLPKSRCPSPARSSILFMRERQTFRQLTKHPAWLVTSGQETWSALVPPYLLRMRWWSKEDVRHAVRSNLL